MQRKRFMDVFLLQPDERVLRCHVHLKTLAEELPASSFGNDSNKTRKTWHNSSNKVL
jgi:hypothetical protein